MSGFTRYVPLLAVFGFLAAGCGDADSTITSTDKALKTKVVKGIKTTGHGCQDGDGVLGQCAYFTYYYDWDPCENEGDAYDACIAAGICTSYPSPGCNAWGPPGCNEGVVTNAYCYDSTTAFCECTCFKP